MLSCAALASFLVIRARGERLSAPPPSSALGAAPGEQILLHVLISLLLVILASRALGALFRHLHQPPILGEVLAGILLGPSLLGRVAPGLHQLVLPEQIAPQLSLLSQIGIVLFTFLIGLELDPRRLRKVPRSLRVISHASMLAPFLTGAALALWLYPTLSAGQVGFTGFACFVGTALALTASPVLARILVDRGMHKSRLGGLALACAAMDDVSAWGLLALTFAFARADAGSVLRTLLLAPLYVWLVLAVLQPILHRTLASEKHGIQQQHVTVAALVMLFASALVSEAIGLHALFGAFLCGTIIPRDSLLARQLRHRLRDLVLVLFMPAFFAFTGLRLQLGLLQLSDLGYGAVIITLACASKLGGSALAARGVGLPWREALGLGISRNTRGLLELIVLHVGLDLGIISPRLFALLVIMAIVTTLLTSPLLSLAQSSSALPPGLEPARST
jgi:Kef-type K+ transport system membrane component KefB